MSALEIDQISCYIPQLDFQDRDRVNSDFDAVVLATGHVPTYRPCVAHINGHFGYDAPRASGPDCVVIPEARGVDVDAMRTA